MVNLDRIRAVHASLESFGESGGGSVEYLKLKPGANILRLLPPHGDREDFWIERKVRFGIGPNGKKIFSPLDPNAPDPARDEFNRLMALGDEQSKKMAHDMREKKRALMWVVSRDEPEKGAQLFDTNRFVLRDILAIFMDSDYGDITDPETGCDITINYTQGSRNAFPKWQVVPRRNSSPLGHPELLNDDLFSKFNIGKPSDTDYVEACLAGNEKAFLDAKKQERESGVPSGPTTPPAPVEEQAAAPAQSEQAAVDAELAKIKAAKAAAPPPPPPAVGTPANLLAATGWYVADGANSKAVDAGEIQELVNAGNGAAMILHHEITGNAWKAASEVGFVASGPTTSQVGADLEKALG